MVAINKDELIDDIKSTYKKLRNQFTDIPSDKVLEETMEWHIKGTKMSLHNLLSYLVGWWELMLKRDEVYTKENRIPDLPDTWYTMNDWWKLAERFYKDYEGYKYDDLLEKFDEIVMKILKMLEKKDNKDVYWIDWYITKSSNKWYTFWRMVALNTSSPYKNAYWRILKWKKLL